MKRINSIDYHVIDACNLACDFCAHYSNFKGIAKKIPLTQIEDEWSLWKEKISPYNFNIIGGEPTLHTDLAEIVMLARSVWFESNICLYTNGLLLHKHPYLIPALRGHAIMLGLHNSVEENEATVQKVKEAIGTNQINLNLIDGNKEWLAFYKIENGIPAPFTDGNQRASWESCIAKTCHVLLDYKLFKCPQIAYSNRAGIKWFEEYKYCTLDDDLNEWLSREDEKCCSNCPATRQNTPAIMMPRIKHE